MTTETDGQEERERMLEIEVHLAERGVTKTDLHAAVYALVVLQTALRLQDSKSFEGISEVLTRLDDEAKRLGTPRWLRDPIELESRPG